MRLKAHMSTLNMFGSILSVIFHCKSKWKICLVDRTVPDIIIVWRCSPTMTCLVKTEPKLQKDTKQAFVWRTLNVMKVDVNVHLCFCNSSNKLQSSLIELSLFFVALTVRNWEEIWVCKLWWAGHHSGLLGYIQTWYWLPVGGHYGC